MGQGIYTEIAYGAIKPPCDAPDEDGYTDTAPWYKAAVRDAEEQRSVRFSSSYEATPYYRGVTIAVSDRVLAGWWSVPTFARHVIPLDDLRDWVAANANDLHSRAIAAWEDIRAAGREAGVEVPEGRLLIVCDWD